MKNLQGEVNGGNYGIVQAGDLDPVQMGGACWGIVHRSRCKRHGMNSFRPWLTTFSKTYVERFCPMPEFQNMYDYRGRTKLPLRGLKNGQASKYNRSDNVGKISARYRRGSYGISIVAGSKS
ncbi:hypothetical protein D3C75_1049210 [compost metagenome]